MKTIAVAAGETVGVLFPIVDPIGTLPTFMGLTARHPPEVECRASMNAPEWLAAYAQRLGVQAPSKDELKAVLDVAAEAAHASERIAAPVACWLAGKAGVELDEALALAREVGSNA